MSNQQASHDDSNGTSRSPQEAVATILENPIVLTVEKKSSADWRKSLGEQIDQLEQGHVLGIVSPDLNREMPTSTGIKKLLEKTRLRKAYERPSIPWLTVLRTLDHLTAFCPGPTLTGNEFPWTETEYNALLKLGWEPPLTKKQAQACRCSISRLYQRNSKLEAPTKTSKP